MATSGPHPAPHSAGAPAAPPWFSAGRRLAPYITAGLPDNDSTIDMLAALDPRCCACAEVGLPFSDPVADGPVIQASFVAALERGFRLDPFFAALRARRGEVTVPLVAMVSYSIVHRRGPASFCAAAAAAGFDALLAPDLAFEEVGPLSLAAAAAELRLVLMVAPTTPPERAAQIGAASSPFVYYQAVAGTTGARATLPPELGARVTALRAAAGKPVCVGFGVSTPEQVAAVCGVADGAIVGSAIVRRILEGVAAGRRGRELAAEIGAFVSLLAGQAG